MRSRVEVVCPVCGERFSFSAIFAHVGGDRCLATLHFDRADRPHNAVSGPIALRLTRELAALIRGLVPEKRRSRPKT